MPGHPASDEDIAEAAAGWIVRLSADDPAERDAARAGFDAWKRADPRHAAVAAGMERFVDQVRGLGGDGGNSPPGESSSEAAARAGRAALGAVLDAPAPVRFAPSRRMTGLLALAFLASAGVALRAFPPSEMLADLRTGKGEQRTQVLADGTRLTLGSATAANIRFSADARHLELLSGEVLVVVAKDPARPFVVETAHGRIQALGTRFIVRRDPAATLLVMIESATEIRARGSGQQPVRVEAGQQARLSGQGVELLAPIDPALAEEAFARRRLVVKDLPLPEVLDELARCRPGVLRYEREQIQGIRVSAVLPLDDTDRALQLLASSFPQLRVRTVTPWVVLVGAER